MFPTHWIYPPRVDVLQPADLSCIAAKLEQGRQQLKLTEDSPQLLELTREVGFL